MRLLRSNHLSPLQRNIQMVPFLKTKLVPHLFTLQTIRLFQGLLGRMSDTHPLQMGHGTRDIQSRLTYYRYRLVRSSLCLLFFVGLRMTELFDCLLFLPCLRPGEQIGCTLQQTMDIKQLFPANSLVASAALEKVKGNKASLSTPD